jgi:carboxypeptidase PM20D1
LLVAVLAINTLRQGSRQISVPPVAKLAVDEQGVAERLGGAIRLQTIASREDPEANAAEFRKLHDYLQQRYPKTHATLKRELVGGLSLLYTWPGSDPKAKPILLLAHQDVVPVAPAPRANWEVPPFSGEVKDGYVWGRGSWDDKGNLIAQMEAVEMLVASGFKPRQTVYLAYGHDEEMGGQRGAVEIAKLLQSRGVKLDFVLDEGLLITEGIMPGLAKPAALIGIAEKGFLSMVLKVPATPGHSSMPPPKGSSAIGMMSAALRRLDDEQLPGGIRGVAAGDVRHLAPEMGGFQRVALSNLWLFGPVVQAQLEKGASTNAMLRTTTALTVVKAGNKENVLPGLAEAVVNFRLLPGDTIASVTEHVRQKADRQRPLRADRAARRGRGIARVAHAIAVVPAHQPHHAPAVSRRAGGAGPDGGRDRFAPLHRHQRPHLPLLAGARQARRPVALSRHQRTHCHGQPGEVVRFYHQLLLNTAAPAN